MRKLVGALQVVLSVSFIWAAAMKLMQPASKLAEMWPWTAHYPALVVGTGIVDLLLGLGLLVPTVFRIRPQFTLFVLYAIVAQMIAAATFHLLRGEVGQIVVNVVFIGMAVFIVWTKRERE